MSSHSSPAPTRSRRSIGIGPSSAPVNPSSAPVSPNAPSVNPTAMALKSFESVSPVPEASYPAISNPTPSPGDPRRGAPLRVPTLPGAFSPQSPNGQHGAKPSAFPIGDTAVDLDKRAPSAPKRIPAGPLRTVVTTVGQAPLQVRSMEGDHAEKVRTVAPAIYSVNEVRNGDTPANVHATPPDNPGDQLAKSATNSASTDEEDELPDWLKAPFYSQFAKITYMRSAHTVLGCCRKRSMIRSLVFKGLMHNVFITFIFSLILVNCGLLIAYDPTAPNTNSLIVATTNFSLAMTAAFTVELGMALVAFGFTGEYGCFRDPWRAIDVAVVVLGWASLSADVQNLGASLRLLRLLRLLTLFPSMSAILNTLFSAIPRLANVFVLIVLCVMAFSLMGLQLWCGVMGAQCAYFDTNAGSWAFPIDRVPCALPCSQFEGSFCTPTYGDRCPVMPVYLTANTSSGGVPQLQQMQTVCQRAETPDWGQTNFDHAGHAIFTSFWMYTTEGWSSVYQWVWHTWGWPWLTFLFFTVHVYIGAFVLLELALGAVWEAYEEQQAIEAKNQRLAMEMIKKLTEHAENRKRKTLAKKTSGALTPSSEANKSKSAFTPHMGRDSPAAATIELPQLTPTPSAAANQPPFSLAASPAYPGLPALEAGTSPGASPGTSPAAGGPFTRSTASTATRSSLGEGASAPTFRSVCRDITKMMSPERCVKFGCVGFWIAIGYLAVVANTALLAVDGQSTSSEHRHLIQIALDALAIYFFTELIVLVSLRGRRFFDNKAALVYVLLVVLMFADAMWSMAQGSTGEAPGGPSGAPRASRIIRTFMAFRLLYSVPALGTVIQHLVVALPAAASAVTVFVAFLFVFGLIGFRLYAGRYQQYIDAGVIQSVPRLNFQTLWYSIVLVFEVCDNENSDQTVKEHIFLFGASAAVFSVTVYVVGCIVLLNVFLAILLSSLEDVAVPSGQVSWKSFLSYVSRRLHVARLANAVLSSRHNVAPSRKKIDRHPCSVVLQPGEDSGQAQIGYAVIPYPGLATGASPGVSPGYRPNEGVLMQIRVDRGGVRVRKLVPKLEQKAQAPSSANKIKSHRSFMLPGTRSPLQSVLTGRRQSTSLRGLYDDFDEVDFHEDEEEEGTSVVVGLLYEDIDATADTWVASGCCPCAAPVVTFRKFVTRFVNSHGFQWSSMLVIVWSCVNLALDLPSNDFCSGGSGSTSDTCEPLVQYLRKADYAITAFFVFEVVLEVISRGFIRGPRSYLRGWRILDLFIAVISVVSVVSASGQIRALRSIRALRALRPLRVVIRYPALKLVIDAFLQSVLRVGPTLVVLLTTMFVFALVGMQVFRGSMYYCNDSAVSDLSNCTGSFNVTDDNCGMLPNPHLDAECRLLPNGTIFPRVVQTQYENFDSIGNSLLTVFELVTGENWPVFMTYAIDGVYMQVPQRDNSPAAALYYLIIELVLNMFMVEIFSGVIVSTYLNLKKYREGSALLTPGQRAWITNMRLLLSVDPWKGLKVPTSTIRWWAAVRLLCFRISKSIIFTHITTGVIIINTAALLTRHYPQSDIWYQVQEGINWGCTIYYLIECLILLLGLGVRQFISRWGSGMAAFLAVGSLVSAIIPTGTAGDVLAMFRVLRIFRISRSFSSLKRVIRTILYAIPAFFNVVAAVIICVFIYTIVGCTLFAGTRYSTASQYMNSDINFDTFLGAFAVLFNSATGENFDGIMHDLAIQEPFCDSTAPGGGITDTNGNCGVSLYTSALYFTSFYTVTSFILLNLFTAVILDFLEDDSAANFAESGLDGTCRLTEASAQKFAEAWRIYDTEKTMWLPASKVVAVLARTPPPLGAFRPAKGVELPEFDVHGAKSLLASLSVAANPKGLLHFHAVLHALLERDATRSSLGYPIRLTLVKYIAEKSRWQPSIREMQAAQRAQRAWRKVVQRRRQQTARAAQPTLVALEAPGAPIEETDVLLPVDGDPGQAHSNGLSKTPATPSNSYNRSFSRHNSGKSNKRESIV